MDADPVLPDEATRRARVLVLGVDRDDDFGRKTGVRTPLVGRDAHLDAAQRILLADPEESDGNAAYAAVRVADQLAKEGESVEVATVCGDARVGPSADRKLVRELEEVLEQVRPERCVVVTDGAEDESFLPLVVSRVRVDSVQRVVVKQHAGLEGTYYVIRKALEDDKVQRTFLMPIALALLVYGVFAVSGNADLGLGAIALTVGVYFLVKVLHVGEGTGRIVRDAYSGLTSGRLTFITTMVSLVLVAGGFLVAANGIWRHEGQATLLRYALIAVDAVVWWIVAAGLVSAFGRVLDAWLKDGSVLWTYWGMPFSLVAFGLVVTAAVAVVDRVVTGVLPPIGLGEVMLLVAGFGVAFLGTLTNAYVQENVARRRGRDRKGRPAS